jgi:hypothetical protein
MDSFKFLRNNQESSNDNQIYYLNTNRIPTLRNQPNNDERFEILFQFDDENPVSAGSYIGPTLIMTLQGEEGSNIVFTDSTSNKKFKLFTRKIQNQTA